MINKPRKVQPQFAHSSDKSKFKISVGRPKTRIGQIMKHEPGKIEEASVKSLLMQESLE